MSGEHPRPAEVCPECGHGNAHDSFTQPHNDPDECTNHEIAGQLFCYCSRDTYRSALKYCAVVRNTIDDCERVATNALNSVMTQVPPIILVKLQDELNRGFAQARERAKERLRS